MELHQIECFLELSKFQNVSLTAEHLNISQPALSKTISLLESELGVKLFDRIGRRIYLNERGALFARYAEQLIETLREGSSRVKNMEYSPNGTISLGLFAYIGLIAECIQGFMSEYPLVKFEIYSSKSQYTIDNFNNIDFTLSSSLGSAMREDFLESFSIAEEQYVLVIAPELLTQFSPSTGAPIKLASLNRLPFLAMAHNLMFSDITHIICQQAGFTPNLTIQTNDFATKLHLTSLGVAASFIPEVCIPIFRSYRNDFLFLRFSEVDMHRSIWLGRKKVSKVSQTCDAFWKYARQYYIANRTPKIKN